MTEKKDNEVVFPCQRSGSNKSGYQSAAEKHQRVKS